jgi:hypothetical protein
VREVTVELFGTPTTNGQVFVTADLEWSTLLGAVRHTLRLPLDSKLRVLTPGSALDKNFQRIAPLKRQQVRAL